MHRKCIAKQSQMHRKCIAKQSQKHRKKSQEKFCDCLRFYEQYFRDKNKGIFRCFLPQKGIFYPLKCIVSNCISAKYATHRKRIANVSQMRCFFIASKVKYIYILLYSRIYIILSLSFLRAREKILLFCFLGDKKASPVSRRSLSKDNRSVWLRSVTLA